MDTMDRSPVTNQRVGEDLGVSHSMISRIRSGDRLPSLALVRRISDRLGWPVEDQIVDHDKERYAKAFEDLLKRRYDA